MGTKCPPCDGAAQRADGLFLMRFRLLTSNRAEAYVFCLLLNNGFGLLDILKQGIVDYVSFRVCSAL